LIHARRIIVGKNIERAQKEESGEAKSRVVRGKEQPHPAPPFYNL
jgi:hypothetical protein